jgi:predicted nucleotidyltransferase
VKQLSPEQHELVSSLVQRLATIPGIRAVVLAGSYARGRAQAASDIDLGLFYSETAPFALADIRELAEAVNDRPGPVVSDFYGWGQWVNGGAWLTVRGQRIDLLYKNLEQLERVIAEAEAGRYQIDFAQQPPFGFFSGTYLGEVAVAVPLFDPEGRIARLKQGVAEYPEALRRTVVQDQLWGAEFGLDAFARKYALRGDVYGTASCLTRAVNQMVLALFALNCVYLVNDKTALAEIAEMERAPQSFSLRVQQTLAQLGAAPAELTAAVESVTQLHRETVASSGGLYQARYTKAW